MAQVSFFVSFAFLATLTLVAEGQRSYLRADGISADTYKLINSFLGGTALEVPDCGHKRPHITQKNDTELGIPVFVFHSHVKEDSDRCNDKTDRQRTEIKTYGPSPAQFKGFYGDTVSYSWELRLNSQLQPSKSFTSFFQIKPFGENSSMPIIAITARLKSSGAKVLQIMYAGLDSKQTPILEDRLSKFVGKWLHITTEYSCKQNGRFSLKINRRDNNVQLMAYENNSMDMWRPGNSFLRPKWGIYRGLNDSSKLRNEVVYFNNFCLAKGEPSCN